MNENKKDKENTISKIVPSKSTGNIKKKSEIGNSPFHQNTNNKVIQTDTFIKDKNDVSMNTSSIINNQIVLKDDLNWFMNNI